MYRVGPGVDRPHEPGDRTGARPERAHRRSASPEPEAPAAGENPGRIVSAVPPAGIRSRTAHHESRGTGGVAGMNERGLGSHRGGISAADLASWRQTEKTPQATQDLQHGAEGSKASV